MCDSEALIRRGAALPKGLGGLVLLVPAALQRVVANGNSEFRHLRARALDHFRPKFGEANLLLIAFQHVGSQQTFEPLSSPGMGRLGDESLLRRLGEIQGLGKGYQIGQLAQRGRSRQVDEETFGRSAGLPLMRSVETNHRQLSPTLGLS